MGVIHRVANRYLLVRNLGEGSVGEVFEAWDELEARWCALKFLRVKASSSVTLQERFRREALAMGRLQHPNIVRIFAWDEDQGCPYLVMELVRGGSLFGWVLRNGPMPPSLAARCAIEICEALQHAHDQGITHRDIKPSNVLIDCVNESEASRLRGVCKVMDFGIARLDEETWRLTRTGMRMGSPGFMAPEQEYDARSADHRADIFGIGATLYALVTARIPKSMAMELSSPEPVLEGPLGRIIMRATLTRPDQRYQSAREMAEALRRVEPMLEPTEKPLFEMVLPPMDMPSTTSTIVAGDDDS